MRVSWPGVVSFGWVIASVMACGPAVRAQCTCMGGAAVGGGVPVLSDARMSLLAPGSFQAGLAYRYAYGASYYQGDERSTPGSITSYAMHYLDLLLSYGFTARFTVDASMGAFPRKSQTISSETMSGSGVSHVYLGGKYLLARAETASYEWSAGAGVQIPLVSSSSDLPQHIDPTTGAVAVLMRMQILAPIVSDDLYAACAETVVWNAENRGEYRYGPTSISACTVFGDISDVMTLLGELRFEYHARDEMYGATVENSGSSVLVISPKISFHAASLTIIPHVDLPLYRYYHGSQLSNDIQAGLQLIWRSADRDE